MGHDDMRAALIYQRATSDADERIALSKLVDQHGTGKADDDDDGLSGQPVPVGCWPINGPAGRSAGQSESPRS